MLRSPGTLGHRVNTFAFYGLSGVRVRVREMAAAAGQAGAAGNAIR